MADVTFDTSDFDAKTLEVQLKVIENTHKALNDIATETLRLSQREVPLDKNPLSTSGFVEAVAVDEVIVGYNKSYAAYQHEGHRADLTHVIKNYQHGRKGKYLEDPIRLNFEVFLSYFNGIVG